MNYVYLLRCSDNTLYCGWTTDLTARLSAHNSGRGAQSTRSRRPVELVYWEEYEDRRQALSREWHLKRLSREEKLTLVETVKMVKPSPESEKSACQ
jgi:putative endonuclease